MNYYCFLILHNFLLILLLNYQFVFVLGKSQFMLSPAKFNIEIGISLCCAQFLAIIIDSAIKIGLDMDGGCVAHGIAFL